MMGKLWKRGRDELRGIVKSIFSKSSEGSFYKNNANSEEILSLLDVHCTKQYHLGKKCRTKRRTSDWQWENNFKWKKIAILDILTKN